MPQGVKVQVLSSAPSKVGRRSRLFIFMSDYNSYDERFEKIVASYTDEQLLAILRSESARFKRNGKSIVDVVGARTRIDTYHDYRCRILAFGSAVFKSVCTEDHRARHLSSGVIYADRLLVSGWNRAKKGGNIAQALRFGVGEQINLEGPILDSTTPQYVLVSQLEDMYAHKNSHFWQALPDYGADNDDKSTFMLGVGLVCEQARLAITHYYLGREHEEAMRQIAEAANMLGGQRS